MTVSHRLWQAGALIVLLVLVSVGIRAADPAPKLTEVQKLQLTNAILTRDLAQARLDALVKEFTIPGYDLTVSGDYQKTPEKPETKP